MGYSYSLPPANEVWGKVIFSQASVGLYLGGGVHPYRGIQGVCIQWGGGGGGSASRWKRDLHPGGLGRPPPPSDTMGYGQQAGGTHPTGMHSCCIDALTET